MITRSVIPRAEETRGRRQHPARSTTILGILVVFVAALLLTAPPGHADDGGGYPVGQGWNVITPAHFVSGGIHPQVGVPVVIVNPTFNREPDGGHSRHMWFNVGEMDDPIGVDAFDECVQQTPDDSPTPGACLEWKDALSYTPTTADIGRHIEVVIISSDPDPNNGQNVDVEKIRTLGTVIDRPGPWVRNVHLQTRPFTTDYSQDDWVDVDEQHPIVAGNPTRLLYDLENTTEHTQSVAVRVLDESGNPVPASVDNVPLGIGQTTTMFVPLKTDALAYDKGEPKASWAFTIKARPDLGPEETTDLPIAVQPRPVILAHGYNSSAPAWDDFKTLMNQADPRVRPFAVGDGQFPGAENTGDLLHPWRGSNSIHQNAEQEALYIQGVRQATGAHHVDVVAHSMGGLITRDYIQNLMPPADYDDKPVVTHLVQLGTPNMGSPCADKMVESTLATPDVFPEPATFQLTTYYDSYLFNPSTTDLKGVELSNLVGTNLPLLECGYYGLSDGVVPETSAAWTIPTSNLFFKSIFHTDMTSNADVVHDYVLPRLTDAPGTGVEEHLHPNGAQPAGASGAENSGDESIAPTFAIKTLTVPAGDTASVDVDVPDGSAFGVTTMAANASLILVSPSGDATTPVTATNPTLPFIGTSSSSYTPGTCTARLTNTGSTPLTAPLSFWVAGSTTTLSAATATVTPSGAGQLTVTVSSPPGDGTTGTPGPATVTAVVGNGQTAQAPVTLVDDGSSGDGAAGDGTYGYRGPLPTDGNQLASITVTIPGQGMRMTSAPVLPAKDADPEPTPAPVITIPPRTQKVAIGSTVTLTYEATGPITSTDWQVKQHRRWVSIGHSEELQVIASRKTKHVYRVTVTGPGGSCDSKPAVVRWR